MFQIIIMLWGNNSSQKVVQDFGHQQSETKVYTTNYTSRLHHFTAILLIARYVTVWFELAASSDISCNPRSSWSRMDSIAKSAVQGVSLCFVEGLAPTCTNDLQWDSAWPMTLIDWFSFALNNRTMVRVQYFAWHQRRGFDRRPLQGTVCWWSNDGSVSWLNQSYIPPGCLCLVMVDLDTIINIC